MRPSTRAGAALLVGMAGTAALAAAGSAASGAGSPIGPAVVSFTTPASSGQTLSQRPVVLNGDVSRSGGFVDSIGITVTWTDHVAGRVPAPHPAQSFTDNPDLRESDVPWDVSPDVPSNGQYTVTVVGTTDGGTGTPQEQTSGSTSFIVDVKPAVPQGVVATVQAASRVTHLAWKANPEPDLLGYVVYRAGPTASDTSQVIGTVLAPQTAYTDDQVATLPAGTYRYSVVAVRQSGSGNGVDQSAPSPEADATLTTPPKSAAPPPPTTAGPSTGSSGSSGSSAPGATGAAPGGAGAAPAAAPNRLVLPPAQGSIPNYQALLNQAQATTVTTAPPDPGFQQHLPYQPQVTRRAVTLPAPDTAGALGAADLPTNSTRRTAEFLAGALLLAVLAMFALFLKRSADQAAMLEALVPEGAAVGGLAADASAIDEEPVVEPTGFDALLAETAIDRSEARERRRTKWSERAARVAVALATDHQADDAGSVVAESPVARRFGLFPDARPRPGSAPAVSEISLDDLPMFGRTAPSGGESAPGPGPVSEPAVVPEAPSVSEAAPVPGAAAAVAVAVPPVVPEMPLPDVRDHDPGPADDVLPSSLLLVLRGGGGADEEEAPPVGIASPALAAAEPALAVAATPSIDPRPTLGRWRR